MPFSSSIRLARVRGIPVRLHGSLLLAAALFAFVVENRMRVVAMLGEIAGRPLLVTPWTWGALLGAGLLGSVAWHEAAHAIAARLVGARIESITLVALTGPSLHYDPLAPRKEALVVGVGPIASLLLGGALYAVARFHPLAHLDAQLALGTLATVQLALGALELLPAPPLDGGRLIEVALTGRMARPKATALVAASGRVSAALLAIFGTLAPSPLALGLAALIWAGSDAAARGAQVEGALSRVHVGTLAGAPLCIDAAESLASLAAHMRRLRAGAWAVSEEGRLAGVVTAADVGRVAVAARGSTCVRDVTQAVPSVALASTASAAMATLRAARVRVLPVVDDGRLVGLITLRALETAGEIGELGPPSEPDGEAAPATIDNDVLLDLQGDAVHLDDPAQGLSAAWRLRED